MQDGWARFIGLVFDTRINLTETSNISEILDDTFFYFSAATAQFISSSGCIATPSSTVSTFAFNVESVIGIGKASALPITHITKPKIVADGFIAGSNLSNSTADFASLNNIVISGCWITGKVLLSRDAVNFEQVTATGANYITAVAATHDRFIGFISNTNTTVYSFNGDTWFNGASLPISSSWQSAAANGPNIVALPTSGNTQGVYSTDNGDTWQVYTITDRNWTQVVYGGGLFVAITADGITNYATSPDGSVWTNRTFAAVRTDLSLANGRLYATNQSWDSTTIVYSTNGSTWTNITMPLSSPWSAVGYINGVYYCINLGEGTIYRSTTGTSSWVKYMPEWYTNGSSCFNLRVVNTDSRLLWAQNSATLTYVNEGAYNPPAGISTNIEGPTYAQPLEYIGNGAFVCSYSSSISVVLGNATYTYLQNKGVSGVTHIVLSNGSLVVAIAVLYGELAYFTNDLQGVVTINATGVPAALNDIWWSNGAFGNGIFVVTSGYEGNLAASTCYMTSTTGTSWTLRTLPQSAIWAEIVYGLTVGFIAIAYDGFFAVSASGTSWSTGTCPAGYKSIKYANGVYCCTSTTHRNTLTSTDGVNWTENIDVVPFADAGIHKIFAGGGLFVATPYYSEAKICISGDGVTWYNYSVPSTITELGYNEETNSFYGVGTNAISYNIDLSSLGSFTATGGAVVQPLSISGIGNIQNEVITSTVETVVYGYTSISGFNVQVSAEVGVGKTVLLPYNTDSRIFIFSFTPSGGVVVQPQSESLAGGSVIIDVVGTCVVASNSDFYVPQKESSFIVGTCVVASNSDFYVPQKVVEIGLVSCVVAPASVYSTPLYIVGKALISPASAIKVSKFIEDACFTLVDEFINTDYLYCFIGAEDFSILYKVLNGDLYSSNNYGNTWIKLTDTVYDKAKCSIDGKYVCAYAFNAVFMSDDYGLTFTDIQDLNAVIVDTSILNITMSFNGKYLLLSTTTGRYFLSSDYGLNWVEQFYFDFYMVYGWTISDDGQHIVAVLENSTTQVSHNGGSSWAEHAINDIFNICGSSDGKHIYINGNSTLASHDYGDTWSNITLAPNSSIQNFICDSTGFNLLINSLEELTTILTSYGSIKYDLYSNFSSNIGLISLDKVVIGSYNNNITNYNLIYGVLEFPFKSIGAVVANYSSPIIRPHFPRSTCAVLQGFGAAKNNIGILTYGINFKKQMDVVLGIYGSNDGYRKLKSSLLEFATVKQRQMAHIQSLLFYGGGVLKDCSIVGSILDGGIVSKSSLLSVDGTQYYKSLSHTMVFNNIAGLKTVSVPFALSDALTLNPTYDAKIYLDGVDVTNIVSSCVLQSDEESIFDTVELTIPVGVDWNLDSKPERVVVTFTDSEFEYIVEEFTGEGASRTIWGRPTTALYSDPWVTGSVWNQNNTTATTARALVEEILGDVVIWEVDDWPLPPIFEISGTPIEAVQAVAQAAGGIIRAAADSDYIKIRSRWPVRLVNMSVADTVISRELAIEEIHSEKNEVVNYGSVIVTGWAPDEILPGIVLEESVNIGQDAFVRLYWSGPDHPVFTNWITDGTATYLGTYTEEYTETLVFEDGVASTANPIWNLIEFNWLGTDYGDLVWLDGGYSTNVESPEFGIGVASVTYSSTYERWQLSGQVVDTVQFGVAVTQGAIAAEVILSSGGTSSGEVKIPLLGDVASCVQYGTSYLDDSSVNKTVSTTIPRQGHIEIGSTAWVEDNLLGMAAFGKIKAVEVTISSSRITQLVEVLL